MLKYSKKFVTAMFCSLMILGTKTVFSTTETHNLADEIPATAEASNVAKTDHEAVGHKVPEHKHTEHKATTHKKEPKKTEPKKKAKTSDNSSPEWKAEAEKLSKLLLPDTQYHKLVDSIGQTSLGLLKAQAQSEGVELDGDAETSLKDAIAKKYTLQFFVDSNVKSMGGLSKETIKEILAIFRKPAAQEFLKVSPSIISNTMEELQNGLGPWVQNEVGNIVASKKEGKHGKQKPTEKPMK